MNLTPQQKSALKNLLQSPHWQIVDYLAEQQIAKISLDSALRETEWDTLKETVRKEGKIEGIRLFIQELYSQAGQ